MIWEAVVLLTGVFPFSPCQDYTNFLWTPHHLSQISRCNQIDTHDIREPMSTAALDLVDSNVGFCMAANVGHSY